MSWDTNDTKSCVLLERGVYYKKYDESNSYDSILHKSFEWSQLNSRTRSIWLRKITFMVLFVILELDSSVLIKCLWNSSTIHPLCSTKYNHMNDMRVNKWLFTHCIFCFWVTILLFTSHAQLLPLYYLVLIPFGLVTESTKNVYVVESCGVYDELAVIWQALEGKHIWHFLVDLMSALPGADLWQFPLCIL